MNKKIHTILTKPYSNDLNECLVLFEKLKYESFGFGVVFLDYVYELGTWGISFRNPKNFSNPNIKEKSPIEACHRMFDFLRTLPEKK